MALVKRIAGGVLFVVALITFLLCVTGTIGAWFAKSAVDETTLALIQTVTDSLELAIQTTDSVDGRIADVEQRLDVVQSALPAFRTERGNGPVAQRVRQVVTEDVQPALEQLTTRAQNLRDGLERLNQRLERFNRMPFVDVPTLGGALATLDEQIDGARTEARTLRTALAARDPVLLQSAGERITQRLGQARTILTDGRTRISALQAALIDLHQVLTFWSTVSTTVVSVLLTIFAVGQVSLAVHAWGWMRGRRAPVLQAQPT